MFDSVLDFLPLLVFFVVFFLNGKRSRGKYPKEEVPAPTGELEAEQKRKSGELSREAMLREINEKLKRREKADQDDRLYMEREVGAGDLARDKTERIRRDGKLFSSGKKVRTDDSSVLRKEGKLRYDGVVVGERKDVLTAYGSRERDNSKIYRDGRDMLIEESEVGISDLIPTEKKITVAAKQRQLRRKELLQGIIVEQLLSKPRAVKPY